MLGSINNCSVFDYDSNKDFITFPFFYKGSPLAEDETPKCCLTLHKTGSMRFRWNEKNENRDRFFSIFSNKQIVPLELIHSHMVFNVDSKPEKLLQEKGDGLISINQNVVPVVTVADCVPIYLYNLKTKCFGVVHSGWKGTGIICDAIDLAVKQYGGNFSDFCVVIGPHIHDCCYSIDSERAEFFMTNYGKECVSFTPEGEARLSLAKANIHLLLKTGVLPENILYCTDCTCCDTRLGSFRRETKSLSQEIDLQERLKHFTPMAAFVCF